MGLRELRLRAGNPTYQAMARRTGRSRTALSEAAGGDVLPAWETVVAYVSFCGEDPDKWRLQWERLLDMRHGLAAAAGAANANGVQEDHHVAEDNPALVHTTAGLARALDRLRAGRSYADLGKAAPPERPLPPSTLSDLLNGLTVPARSTVAAFLTACDLVGDDEQAPWLAAWERVVAAAQMSSTYGRVHMGEARPRLFGVHAAIQVRQGEDELPPYVARDVDPALRAALGVAGSQGGFLLLIGASAAGKTRTMYEAARAVLPDWEVVQPDDAEAIRAFAAAPTPRTVLWLDELQRYLRDRFWESVEYRHEPYYKPDRRSKKTCCPGGERRETDLRAQGYRNAPLV